MELCFWIYQDEHKRMKSGINTSKCSSSTSSKSDPMMSGGPVLRSVHVRLAALLDLPLVQAVQNVVPIATTASESVDRLRQWASGRCLNAEAPGLYQSQATPRANGRRSVTRTKPSQN